MQDRGGRGGRLLLPERLRASHLERIRRPQALSPGLLAHSKPQKLLTNLSKSNRQERLFVGNGLVQTRLGPGQARPGRAGMGKAAVEPSQRFARLMKQAIAGLSGR